MFDIKKPERGRRQLQRQSNDTVVSGRLAHISHQLLILLIILDINDLRKIKLLASNYLVTGKT